MKTALIAGATGLVGSALLDELASASDYDSIVTVGRREMPTRFSRHRHQVIDFDRLEEAVRELVPTDVFCALGTTIKKAGSREAFERVDHEYPLRLARSAREAGAEQYLVVTAQGASERSPFFYNRVKGRLESDLGAIGFYGTYLFRPTLLLGDREERRPGEAAAEKAFALFRPIMRGPLRRLRPIEAGDVGRSMTEVARSRPGGFKAYEADDMRQLVRRSNA